MTPADLAVVRALIAEIDRRPIPNLADLAKRRKSFFAKLFGRALAKRSTLGEASQWRGTVVVSSDLDEHRDHVKKIANDIPHLADVFVQAVEHYYETGTAIAPYPAMRICINLRKAKEFALEVDFIRALLIKIPNISHAQWFEHRLKAAEKKSKR